MAARGGTIEKFSGDAVMAVFGIPTAHEDDPERAVRAATAPSATAWATDDRRCAIGVESGEVVVGDPFGGATMATGDAMNVAARLEQQAQPGEVVIGANVHGSRCATWSQRSRWASWPCAAATTPCPAGASRRCRRRLAGRAACPASRRRSPAATRNWPLCSTPPNTRQRRAQGRALHHLRRARRGQEPADARGHLAPGRRRLARRPRPLPALRRRHHLLAGGRDRPRAGRHRRRDVAR